MQAVATRLKLSLEQQFVLEASDPTKHADVKPLFPTPCTVRLALTRYVDLSGVPKKCVIAWRFYLVIVSLGDHTGSLNSVHPVAQARAQEARGVRGKGSGGAVRAWVQ